MMMSSSLTPELFVAILTLGLWLISAGLVFRESPRSSNYMAVAQTEIWNTNLFFGSWISIFSAVYLVADLITVRNPSGLLPKECSLVMGNAIPRGWVLSFVASLALFVFGTGKNGNGDRAVSAIVFGFLGILLSFIYLLITLLERQSRQSNNSSSNSNINDLHNSKDGNKGKMMSNNNMNNMPKARVVSSLLSITSLLCFSINVAFGTAPPSSSSCNVYFSSWICFAISLYLCIRHAELYLVPGSTTEITTLAQEGHYSADRKDPHLPINKHGMKRLRSKNSVSTASPHTQYSDDDTTADGHSDDNYDQSAEEVMTAMADSTSEDGPMLFLPIDDDQETAESDTDGDASYPSMTLNHHRHHRHHHQQPPTTATHHQDNQYQRQYQQLEPNKPRSTSPHAASTSTGRSKIDPSVNLDTHFNSKVDPHGHLESSGTILVDDIDTKLQARVSSSGSESHKSHNKGSDAPSSTRKSGGGSKGRRHARRKNKPSNPEGRRFDVTSSVHVNNQLTPKVAMKDPVATDENPQVDHRAFSVEDTMQSMTSSEESTVPSLKRTTTRSPPVVNAPRSSSRNSQQQGAAKSRRISRDPSFQDNHRQQLVQQQRRTQAPRQVESVDFEATVTTTQDSSVSRGASTKSGFVPSSRQRSGSKSRSRSSGRSKKRHSREHSKASSSRKSNPSGIGLRRSSGDNIGINSSGPSTASNSSDGLRRSLGDNIGINSSGPSTASNSSDGLRRSLGDSTGINSSGPSTVSKDSNSSGVWGQGPATMSASGEGGRIGHSMDSGPLTDEEGMEEIMMGRVGPGRVEALPMPLYAENDNHTDPGRPMVTVHSNIMLPDAISMVSEPTLDSFDPPGEEYNTSSTRNQRQHAVPSSSGPPNVGWDAPHHSSSSGTNGNNKAMRQGAVDKMVMEALRQAQEARGSVAHPPPPPPRAIVDFQRQNFQPSKNPSGESKRKKSLSPGRGGKQQSMRSRSSSHSRRSQDGSSSKSPRSSNKPQASYHKQSYMASRPPSFPGRPAGSGLRGPGISNMHSFYSGSDSTSLDADDAFAC